MTTDEDRAAAASVLLRIDEECGACEQGLMLAGEMDDDPLVRAFTAHRLAAIAAATPAIERGALERAADAWDGLPRQIMMWLDMEPKTPRALFKHLERCGEPIPQWLRDEPEMQNLDHVPSKGTRCVVIFKAMQEQATRNLINQGA